MRTTLGPALPRAVLALRGGSIVGNHRRGPVSTCGSLMRMVRASVGDILTVFSLCSPALRAGRYGVEDFGAAADGCQLARVGGEHHRRGGAPEVPGRDSRVGHWVHSSMTLSLPAVSRVSELISQQNEDKPSHTPTPDRDRVWQDCVADGAFVWVNASAQPEASGEEVASRGHHRCWPALRCYA